MTRFLYLFADHRAALAQAQRAEDMLLQERARADKAEELLHAAQQDAIRRERELLDRATLQPKHEPFVASPEDLAENLKQVRPSARDAVVRAQQKFMQDLEARARQLQSKAG